MQQLRLAFDAPPVEPVRLLPHSPNVNSVRDNAWLERQLEYVWSCWFTDVPRLNPVVIRFVRPWKRRLAVIHLTDGDRVSFIGINGLLSDLRVPYTICVVTIAHELTHYWHGFGSRHPRRYRHPHRGNVVQRELNRRGLARELKFYTQWTDETWFELLPSLLGANQRAIENWPDEMEEQAAARVS